jgi:hypothetical protein
VLFRSDGGSGGGMSWARHWISEFLYTRRCTYPQSIYFYFFFSYLKKKRNEKTKRKEVLFHVAFSHGAHLTERWELNERAAQAHYPPLFLVGLCLLNNSSLIWTKNNTQSERGRKRIRSSSSSPTHFSEMESLFSIWKKIKRRSLYLSEKVFGVVFSS